MVKFWVAQSFTDDLPVHPAWLLLDTVAKKLDLAEPNRWKRSELEMAYILPGTHPPQLSNPQKKLFGSRMDLSIFQGGRHCDRGSCWWVEVLLSSLQGVQLEVFLTNDSKRLYGLLHNRLINAIQCILTSYHHAAWRRGLD